jgi:hypothetical protein
MEEFLTCPYGHPLKPGNVVQGWSPCICPPAWDSHGGHKTLECLECSRHDITSIRYEPEHVGGGHLIRQSVPGEPGGGGSRGGEPVAPVAPPDRRDHGA